MQRVPLRLLVVGLSLLGTMGCGARLKSASAGQVGCPANEIEITEVGGGMGPRTWVATCRGRRFHCSAAGHVSCTPALAQPPVAPSSTPAQALPPQPAPVVTRRQTDNGSEISARIPLGPTLYLLVVANPTAHPGQALLIVQHDGTPGAHSNCNVRVMLDGELVEPGTARYEVQGNRERVSVETTFELVERMARTQRVIGRVCNDEFRVDDQARAVLSELVARVREETVFNAPSPGPTTGGEEPVPDFEGGP